MKQASRRLARLIAPLLLALTAHAHAQSDPDRFSSERARVRQLASEHLARAATLRLRALDQPEERDYAIVGLAYELAQTIRPGVSEFLRRRIDAWHEAGDNEEVLRATAQLLTLEPNDTVALLRLISARIARVQRAEDRLAMYDRLTGRDGESIPPSVRSRLALDAALLSRERGDDAGFAARLALATSLDPANKDAAVLAAETVLAVSTDPIARAEVLLNLILADPLDPAAHYRFARELREQGAFTAAVRFQAHAERLYVQTGYSASLDESIESIVGQWQLQGADRILELLQGIETNARETRRQQIAYAQAAGVDPGPPLEEYRLDPKLELVRLAANLALDRKEAAQASLNAILAELDAQLERLSNPPEGYTKPTPEQIEQRRLENLATGLLARLWCGADSEGASVALEELKANGSLTGAALKRFEAMLAFRNGDNQTAIASLTQLSGADVQADIALAEALLAKGDRNRAIATLARVALEHRSSLPGAYARSRVQTLLGQPVLPTQDAKRVEEYCARLPAWIDDMVASPRSFIFVTAKHVADRGAIVDSQWLRVAIKNLGRVPLALGPGRAISSRLLLTPSLGVQGVAPPTSGVKPEIVELDRKLTLRPGESVESDVWVGHGQIGAFLDSVAPAYTIRWQVTQNFAINREGGFTAGPLSVTTDSGIRTRAAIGLSGDTPDAVAKALPASQGDTLLEIFFFTRALALTAASYDPPDTQATADAEALTKAVAARYPSLTEGERVLAVLILAPAFKAQPFALDELASNDPSPYVRLAYLLTRAPEATDPAYASTIENPDPAQPRTAELARLLRDARASTNAAPANTPNK